MRAALGSGIAQADEKLERSQKGAGRDGRTAPIISRRHGIPHDGRQRRPDPLHLRIGHHPLRVAHGVGQFDALTIGGPEPTEA